MTMEESKRNPSKTLKSFGSFLKSSLEERFSSMEPVGNKTLQRCMEYTLKSPSSYFRPELVFGTAEALRKPPESFFPWAGAVEMIHIGSLIQDDLPFMDNGTTRRGTPCNHLVFGESFASLGSSSFYIEAFSFLLHPSINSKSLQLLSLLVEKAGVRGLMGGQALDLSSNTPPSLLHQLKTGRLIEASVEGVALFGSRSQRTHLSLYAKSLGEAYQLSDNLIDGEGNIKEQNDLLKELTERSLEALKPFQGEASRLRLLSKKNMERVSSL